MNELKVRKKSATALGAIQIVIGILLFISGVVFSVVSEECHGLQLFASGLFILSGSFGVGLAKRSTKCLVVTGLVFAVLSALAVFTVVGGTLAFGYYHHDDDWGCPEISTGEFGCALNVSGSLVWDQNKTCTYLGNERCGPNPNVTHTTLPTCEAVEEEILCSVARSHHHGHHRGHDGRGGKRGHGGHKGHKGHHRGRRDDHDDSHEDDDDEDEDDREHGHRSMKVVFLVHAFLFVLELAMALGQLIVCSLALCCKSQVRPGANYVKQKAEKPPLAAGPWVSVDDGPKAQEAFGMFSPPPAYTIIAGEQKA